MMDKQKNSIFSLSPLLALTFAAACLPETDLESVTVFESANEADSTPGASAEFEFAEYIGDVDLVSDEEFDEALAAWYAQTAERPMSATDEELASSSDEDRGVMVLTDGRMFWADAGDVERVGGELERTSPPREALAPVSQVTWTGIYLGIVGQTVASAPADGRSRTTSTTGSFKSMVKITADGGWAGSGVIVGPRHVLTAAHNVYETNSNVMRTNVKVRLQKDNTLHAVPAAKIFFTAGWMNLTAASSNQSVVRYDYALLVTSATIATGTDQDGGFFDVNYYVDPTALLGRTYNLYGYPGTSLACAAAPVKEPAWYSGTFGKCGDALYGMAGTILDTPTYMAQHDLDVQPGQSGAALYEHFADTGRRVVRGIQSIHVQGFGGYAHQINSESSANINGWISANP